MPAKTRATARKTTARPRKAAATRAKAPRAPASVKDGTAEVDDYMKALKHPLKAEMQVVREIIRDASGALSERIKWNAPSFFAPSSMKDMVAFHPRATDCVHLVFVFHDGAMIKERHGLLEGDYKDRRMAKFRDLTDVKARRSALETVVKEWVRLHA